jgi:hypothetical protein
VLYVHEDVTSILFYEYKLQFFSMKYIYRERERKYGITYFSALMSYPLADSANMLTNYKDIFFLLTLGESFISYSFIIDWFFASLIDLVNVNWFYVSLNDLTNIVME